MSYIDIAYYRDDYLGEEVDDDKTLQRYINRATETIDEITRFKIMQVGFEKLPPFVQSQIKKAVASQVEYFALHESVNVGIDSEVSRVQIGGFDYWDNSELSRSEKMISPRVKSHLLSTGFIYAGVDVYG